MQRQAKGVKRVQIYLDPEILRVLDEAARTLSLSRSAMLAQLVRTGAKQQAAA